MSQQTTKFNNGNGSEERFLLSQSVLSRVLNEAPYLARCSDNKTASLIRPRDVAIRYPYMQINRPGMVSWLIFDLDHRDPWIWEKVGLPAPNLIVTNPAKCSAHLFYSISPVCTSDAARHKPQQLLRAIYTKMAEQLGADPDYHGGPVAKTPGHRWWRTSELHTHQYDLTELLEYFDLPRLYLIPAKRDSGKLFSRHCSLFDQVRYYAYSLVGHYKASGNYEFFCSVVRQYAEARNKFKDQGYLANLPQSSIRSTVRSICRWTWTKYRGQSAVNRGVMNLPEHMPLKAKQKKSAERTHSVRKDKTATLIKQAISALQKAGQPLSLARLSKLVGLTRQTIAKYKFLLEAPEPAQLTVNPIVNYGVHQISTVGLSFDDSVKSSFVTDCSRLFLVPSVLADDG